MSDCQNADECVDGHIDCWSPGGPCPEPNDSDCEFCGACLDCAPAQPEVHYAVRRKDGRPIGEFSFWVVPDEKDWSPVLDHFGDETEFEMIRLEITVLETRTYPQG